MKTIQNEENDTTHKKNSKKSRKILNQLPHVNKKTISRKVYVQAFSHCL